MSPIDIALPGVLPVLNERVVDLAIRLGLAVNATVNGHSVFARKNYFYPDMPKDFQISQFDLPINGEGWLELADGRRIGIERAHLEEDTGKSLSLIHIRRCRRRGQCLSRVSRVHLT
mgnify:CR=1 FL=1